MDDRTFDQLAKTFSVPASRRTLAGVLATLGAGLGDVAAKPRHGGKGKRKGKGKGKRKGKGKDKDKGNGGNEGCTPDLKDTVCAGRCGPVTNTCGKRVECGPCAACAAGGSTDGTACTLAGGDTGVCTGAACTACGEPGQPCCPGDTPCADFGCCDPANGRCVAGGGVAGRDFAPKCEGETMVCDCGQDLKLGNGSSTYTCTRPGICRPNHAPRALDAYARSHEPSICVPVTLWIVDSDFDQARFVRIVKQPDFGFLSGSRSDSVIPSDPPAGVYPLLKLLEIDNPPGWATALPAPRPDLSPSSCYPRCAANASGRCLAESGFCEDCPDVSSHYACPEGGYQSFQLCYHTIDTARIGFDYFEWVAIDQHGAESEPAFVRVEIYEA